MGRGFNKSKSPRGGGGRRASGGNGGFSGGGRRQQQRGRSFDPPPSKKRGRGHATFTPKPPPPLPEALSSLPKFIKTNKFRGAKLGYFFSRGKVGVGYYIDRVQIGQMGQKPLARLAASAAAQSAPPSANEQASAGGLKVTGGKKTEGAPTSATAESSPATTVPSSKKAKKEESTVASPERDGSTASDSNGMARGDVGEINGVAEFQRANASQTKDHEGAEAGESTCDSREEEDDSEEERDGVKYEEGEANGKALADEEDGENGDSDSEGDSDCEDSEEDNYRESGEAGDDGVDADRSKSQQNGAGISNGKDTQKTKEANVGAERDELGEEDDDESASDDTNTSSQEASNDGEGEQSDTAVEVIGSQAQNGKVKRATKEEEKAARTEKEEGGEVQEGQEEQKVSFASLGVTGPLCEAAAQLGWTHATEIQRQALPLAFQGKDVIGLAETGSGKTGAFAVPILQALLANPQRLFAVVLAPTRELAFQINEVMEALGVGIGLKTVCIVGGIDMFQQSVALALKPHVVIATPGRLVDHLENTKGFSLRTAKFLVLDEADRMLSMDFEEEINKVLTVLPRDRRTFLFSATMTSKVAKLQRASLKDPVRVEITHKFATPKTLVQQYLFIPAKHKDCYLAYVLNEFAGQSTIVFVSTCNNAQRVALLLRNLGFQAVCLHGQMGQPKRLGALGKFKSGERNVLIATDVASRGLDIPSVDLVVNMEIPSHGKDYIHRVGRTARAGRAGRSIAFVSQYDVEVYQRMEALIGQKLPPYTCDEETVLVLQERVGEAQRMAAREMREADFNRKGKGRRGGGADHGREDTETVVRSFKRQRMGGGGGRGGGGGGKGGRGGRR